MKNFRTYTGSSEPEGRTNVIWVRANGVPYHWTSGGWKPVYLFELDLTELIEKVNQNTQTIQNNSALVVLNKQDILSIIDGSNDDVSHAVIDDIMNNSSFNVTATNEDISSLFNK